MKYKKILFATTNSAKVIRLKKFLQDPQLEIIALSDLEYTIPEPKEEGSTPLKVAEEKARYYWKNLKKEKYIVLSQDDTIKFIGVEKKDEPGISIKDPVKEKYGKFSDELAIKHYTNLAKKYGGEIEMYFNYGHALYDGKILKSKASRLKCRLVDEVSSVTVDNYFLSSIIKVLVNGEWKFYSEFDDEELVRVDRPLGDSVQSLLDSL